MTYEAELARIRETDGVIRDLRKDIRRKEALARAMVTQGLLVARQALMEALNFADAIPLPNVEDPFSNMSPGAEAEYSAIDALVHVDLEHIRTTLQPLSSDASVAVATFVESYFGSHEQRGI